MSERTLQDALTRAKSLRDFQVNSPERFETCPDFQDIVILANEVERLTVVVDAAIRFRRAESAVWVESEVGTDESVAEAKAERPKAYAAFINAVDGLKVRELNPMVNQDWFSNYGESSR